MWGILLPLERSLEERGIARLFGKIKLDRMTMMPCGEACPGADVDVASLRRQHREWATEFGAYFGQQSEPDISWAEAELAVRELARELGVALPSV